jgi:hypothetical protein
MPSDDWGCRLPVGLPDRIESRAACTADVALLEWFESMSGRRPFYMTRQQEVIL